MKGLTPEEYGKLRYLASPHMPRPVSTQELELASDLESQGRIGLVVIDEDRARYVITPAGREALRLWPLVRAAMGAP